MLGLSKIGFPSYKQFSLYTTLSFNSVFVNRKNIQENLLNFLNKKKDKKIEEKKKTEQVYLAFRKSLDFHFSIWWVGQISTVLILNDKSQKIRDEIDTEQWITEEKQESI